MQIQYTRLKSYSLPGSLPVEIATAVPKQISLGLAITNQIQLELKL